MFQYTYSFKQKVLLDKSWTVQTDAYGDLANMFHESCSTHPECGTCALRRIGPASEGASCNVSQYLVRKERCFFCHDNSSECCKTAQVTNGNLRSATALWASDVDRARLKFGSISAWDVSRLTRLDNAFSSMRNFNADLSGWNTSRVTSMYRTFFNATNFNADVSKWDTARVRDLTGSFSGARAFNADLSKWEISNVESLNGTFANAEKFNSNLSEWDVSSVQVFDSSFEGAREFNSDISSWTVAAATSMEKTFYKAKRFNFGVKLDVSWKARAPSVYPGTLMFQTTCTSDSACGYCGNIYHGGEFGAAASLVSCSTLQVRMPNDTPCGFCKANQEECCIYRASNSDLSAAVDMWEEDMLAARAELGPISVWDTSEVTNLASCKFS